MTSAPLPRASAGAAPSPPDPRQPDPRQPDPRQPDPRQKRRRRPNLARLNHIFVPRRSDERDRFRRGLSGVLIRPVWWMHGALSREGRAAVGLTALVAAAGLDVGSSQVYLLWAAMAGLLVGSLAMRPFFAMHGAQVRVQAPRRATAHEAVTFAIDVAAVRGLAAVRVDLPFLPWDGQWIQAPRGIATIEAGATATTTATARFVERGEHHLDPFHARALVPLGLAAGPAVRSDTCRFVVLPRVARVESIQVDAGASADRRRVTTQVPAADGDLAGVRPYRPGDAIRHLHARTWARVGTPHVREHLRERSERSALFLVADATSDEALIEAAVSLAAGVAAALGRSEAGVGLVALGDEMLALPGGSSPRGALDDILDRLATWAPPKQLVEADVVGALAPFTGGLSSAVVVATDRDRAPGEVPETALAIVEALRAAGIGVRIALVVEEDAAAGESAEVVRISRGAIERLEPIRL